jgi:hypothetical protein
VTNTTDRLLVEWAERVRKSCPPGPQHLRDRLEAMLKPMIRCAWRDGLGEPNLVRWVRQQLPLLASTAGGDPDPLSQVAPLARLLGERVLARLDPLPGRETLVA